MAIIRICEDLSMETFKVFSEDLRRIALEDPGKSPVNLQVFSNGGSVYAALAYAAAIRRSSKPIYTYAYGLVASSAVLLLASGSKRYMTKEAWVMVHESSDKLKGNMSALEKDVAQLRLLEIQWCELLEELTSTKKEVWAALHKENAYLNAKQCLDLGLVDEII